ncbi:proto-oncogene serine/threonine-protein kinase mos [Drosophila navojoa]|uniref:proto-oncogene serine/threonine-protein kinase mos n=1 Tax=Drosophila navojoa TaxID=7232 RepID=UPI000846D2D0|nr:proto-oncogene serine/threonine-protein kinase mos [Drosophila navojoa]
MSILKRENALVLTTPKRIELLKDGPPATARSNRCQILGRGAYGTVFKAIYREHAVALKIIKAGAVSTLQNEAHILNWKHKNIVRLIKLESTPEFGLLIMELPSGLCLQRVLDTLALPLLHRVFITLDILAALRYCHCQQVLHLDVKPPNVLVALGTKQAGFGRLEQSKRRYICKLCDFGSSIRLGDEQCGVKGTLRYMSPEALRSLPLSSASDIYSLGITMWQLQSRRLPFHTLNCNESIAYQVVKHDLRPDNYALLESLKMANEPLPLSGCYCATDWPDSSVELICSYIGRIRPQVDVLLSTDVYKKVRRNLNFEANHGRVHKRHKQRKQPRLAHYFDEPSCDQVSRSLEGAYSELYRGCWLSQPELRLNAVQLQKRLELILNKYIST